MHGFLSRFTQDTLGQTSRIVYRKRSHSQCQMSHNRRGNCHMHTNFCPKSTRIFRTEKVSAHKIVMIHFAYHDIARARQGNSVSAQNPLKASNPLGLAANRAVRLCGISGCDHAIHLLGRLGRARPSTWFAPLCLCHARVRRSLRFRPHTKPDRLVAALLLRQPKNGCANRSS